MNNILAKIANVSLLALAALPLIALGVAHAQPVRINISDLDLSNPAQVATLDARIDRAADKFCRRPDENRPLPQFLACKAGARQEAMEQVRAIRASQQAHPAD